MTPQDFWRRAGPSDEARANAAVLSGVPRGLKPAARGRRGSWFVRSVVLVLVAAVPNVHGADYVFDVPSDDRWHYPFNFTPGARGAIGCFGSFGNLDFPEFNDRDGVFVIGWETVEFIDAGLDAEMYDVCSVSVRATNTPGATWPIDVTVDDLSTFYGQPDPDPGRPIELFGAGFGPHYKYETWTEFDIYEGGRCNFEGTVCSNDPRDPYPFVFQPDTLEKLHVEDSVKGTQNEDLDPPLCDHPLGICPFTPTPWAIGHPIDYRPGQQAVPFDVAFDINLSLSDGAVRGYFQEQLAGGRVFVVVTSLILADFRGGQSTYPTFFSKEVGAPEARPAQLVIRLKSDPPGDVNGDGFSTVDEVGVGLECLGGPDGPLSPPESVHPATCRCAFDADGDGDVDLRDVADIMCAFTGG